MKSFYSAAALAAIAVAQTTVADIDSLTAVAQQFIDLFDANDNDKLSKTEVETIRTYIQTTYGIDIWDYAVLDKPGVKDAMQTLASDKGKIDEYNSMAGFFNVAGDDTDTDSNIMTRVEALDTAFGLLKLAIKGDADYDGSVSHTEIDAFVDATVEQDIKDMAKSMTADDSELTINDTLKAAKTLLIQNRQQHTVVGADDNSVTRLELFFRTLQGHMDDEDLLVRGDEGNTALTM